MEPGRRNECSEVRRCWAKWGRTVGFPMRVKAVPNNVKSRKNRMKFRRRWRSCLGACDGASRTTSLRFSITLSKDIALPVYREPVRRAVYLVNGGSGEQCSMLPASYQFSCGTDESSPLQFNLAHSKIGCHRG